MKRALRAGLSSLIAAAAPRAWRASSRPRLVIMMYHRILPADHPDSQVEQPGMITRPESFAMHLQELRRRFELVHLDDWIEQRESPRVPKLACAVTFDDGWRDNYQYAWPVLREMHVPATIFLVSDLIGTDGTYWPTQLARALLKVPPSTLLERAAPQLQAIITPHTAKLESASEHVRRDAAESIIDACKDLPDAWLRQEIARLEPHAETQRDIVSAAEIAEMARTDVMRFGSHTRRHQRLARVTDPAVIEDEVVGSKQALESIVGKPVRTFCFPNGEQSDHARPLIERHYSAAVTTLSGWNGVDSDRWALRRIGVHDDISRTPAAFLSRVSGLL